MGVADVRNFCFRAKYAYTSHIYLHSDPAVYSVNGDPGIRVKAENILGGPASYRSRPNGMCV